MDSSGRPTSRGMQGSNLKKTLELNVRILLDMKSTDAFI